MQRIVTSTALLLVTLLASRANAHAAPANVIKARQLVFGVENVDARTGAVDKDKVVFSWLTNATLAASIRGHVVLLDTFVHRPETVPGRTPFVVEDLVSLRPEAAFLGHGHGDHADNAAYLSGKLNMPVYASAETCIALQGDARTLFNQGVIAVSQIVCHDVTSAGSEPGAEVVKINALEPVASIIAFRHLHSGTSYAETNFPITPVNNEADPRDAAMYPPGTALSYKTVALNGGPVSIYFHFAVRGDNRFSFVWHNTTGDLNFGCSIDRQPPNCWGARVGKQVENVIRSLPPTDVEFGSMVSLGYRVNGMRDPIQYGAALHPKVYVPIHQTNAALPTSSLWFKIAYLKQLDQMLPALKANERPEARWMVDPDDYLKPMVYDPKDARWSKGRSNGDRDDHDD
jgi:L-ascorbate metabolism protein UlaG (beta-lactamase superfamily)